MAGRLHQAWETIFKEKDYDLSQDLHFVTAQDIKSITGEEARLMAKADSTKDLPEVMRNNGYFILPVKNGEYAIVRGNGFHNLEQKPEAKDFESRVKFNLSAIDRNTSEMQYLDYSLISGLTEHVVNKGTLYSIIRGRERSGDFAFNVNHSRLKVSGVQIEVDLGLEGEDSIVLLEAKSRTIDDFIIRQLYYPYRRFTNLAPQKKILPMFFTYESSTGTYNYWLYEFTNLEDYNSLNLLKTDSYKIINPNPVTLDEISVGDITYTDVIPQANDLEKVIKFVFKVAEGLSDASVIAEYFGFDARQSSYYREAAESLGLVAFKNFKYELTEIGRHLVSLESQERNIFFAKVLAGSSLIKEGMDILKSGRELTKQDIENIIASRGTLSGTTIPRRASSLLAWYKWIAENTGTISIDKDSIKVKST